MSKKKWRNRIKSYYKQSAPATGRRLLFICFWLFNLSILIAFIEPLDSIAQANIPYKVSIEGISDLTLLKLVESVSETVNLGKQPPLSRGLLKRRVDQDIPRLMKVLRSQGFYGSEIKSMIDFNVDPVQVVFQVSAGPPYVLKTVDLELTGLSQKQRIKLPGLEELGLKIGEPARSEPIINATKIITHSLSSHGFPFPKIEQPKVVVDHLSETVNVTYSIDPGPPGAFGPVEIKGLESVDSGFIKRKIPWKDGDLFNAGLLEKARMQLLGTGLFTMIRIETADRLDEKEQLPVIIQVKERKHRTLKVGLGYKTDEGPGGSISWEHRNIFHHGENLNFTALGSGITYALEGAFKKPEFRRPDQTLLFNLRLADDHPDAFKSKNVTAMGQIKRNLSQGMDVAAGIGLRYSDIEQFGTQESFQLLSLPVDFNWDRSNDLLDPSKGGRLNLNLSPYFDFIGKNVKFNKASGRYSHYFKLSSRPVSVLALRGMVGVMTGAERDEIPADIRFYAGGGGSIRGYAYQSVGPLFNNVEPLGGRSLISLSSEIRVMVTEKIGVVPFVDGGNVFESTYPDFKDSLQWGAGIGIRYYTPIGPLRFDVGFPLNKRDGIDDPFQIYISLGQAF
jgi:translocation and assembly module TamA